jgi:hypothetical protein
MEKLNLQQYIEYIIENDALKTDMCDYVILKELSTTQIYAKVLDKKKQEAENQIPSNNE